MQIRTQLCWIDPLAFEPPAIKGRLMNRANAWRAVWERVALLLLLLAVIFPRILVPAGYMPDAGYAMKLTLCTGTGTTEITVDPGTTRHDRDEHDGGAQHQPCAFAASALPVLPGAPLLLLAAAIAYVIRHGVAADTSAPPLAAPYLRPPLRGPPLA
jgi:hypothetical protein